MRWATCSGVRPKTRTVPLSGFNKPRISLRSVVFPPPLGPMMTRKSPRGTVRLASRRTGCPLKENHTSRTSMIVSVIVLISLQGGTEFSGNLAHVDVPVFRQRVDANHRSADFTGHHL